MVMENGKYLSMMGGVVSLQFYGTTLASESMTPSPEGGLIQVCPSHPFLPSLHGVFGPSAGFPVPSFLALGLGSGPDGSLAALPLLCNIGAMSPRKYTRSVVLILWGAWGLPT